MKLINAMLLFFLLIGLFLTGFQIYFGVTEVGGYFVSVIGFILFPIFLLYGITFGFSMSEKATNDYNNRRDKFEYNEIGITFTRPVFDIVLKTNFKNIKNIEFYINDDYNEYILYLIDLPDIVYKENPWFLNSIFPYKNNRKEIHIKSDSKGFNQISIMKSKHLQHFTLKK